MATDTTRGNSFEVLLVITITLVFAWAFLWGLPPAPEHAPPRLQLKLPTVLQEGQPFQTRLLAGGSPTPLFHSDYEGLEVSPVGQLFWQAPPPGQHRIALRATNIAGTDTYTWVVWVERQPPPKPKRVQVQPPLPVPKPEPPPQAPPAAATKAEPPPEPIATTTPEPVPEPQPPPAPEPIAAAPPPPPAAAPPPAAPEIVVYASSELIERGKSSAVTRFDLRANGASLPEFLNAAQAAGIKVLLVGLSGQRLLEDRTPYTVAADPRGELLAMRSSYQHLRPQLGTTYSRTFFRLAQVPERGTWSSAGQELRRKLGLDSSYQIVGVFPYALLGALDAAVAEHLPPADAQGSPPVIGIALTADGGLRLLPR